MPGCQGTRRVDPLEGVGPGGKLVLSADCGGTTTRYALSFSVVIPLCFAEGLQCDSVPRLMLYKVNWTDPVEKKQRAPGMLIKEEKYPNIAFKSLQDLLVTVNTWSNRRIKTKTILDTVYLCACSLWSCQGLLAIGTRRLKVNKAGYFFLSLPMLKKKRIDEVKFPRPIQLQLVAGCSIGHHQDLPFSGLRLAWRCPSHRLPGGKLTDVAAF